MNTAIRRQAITENKKKMVGGERQPWTNTKIVVTNKLKVCFFISVGLFVLSCCDAGNTEKTNRQLFIEYLNSINFYKSDSTKTLEEINEKILDSLSIPSLNLLLYRISAFYGEEYRVVLFDTKRRKGYIIASVNCGQPLKAIVGDKSDSTCAQILTPLCNYLADMKFVENHPVKKMEINSIIGFLDNIVGYSYVIAGISYRNRDSVMSQLERRVNVTIYDEKEFGLIPVDSLSNIKYIALVIEQIISGSKESGNIKGVHNLISAQWPYMNSYIFLEDSTQKKYYIHFSQVNISVK
ncbi:MAG: hypothetical protein K1X81_06760 [Bacteroidia bacterium]|nr:hypothetical protein [Bacteroidia bacterium]